MSWLPIATQTVTRRRATLGAANPARYNAQEWDWSSPDDLDIAACSVQPVVVAEVPEGEARDPVASRWQVFAPPAADVRATNRIVFDGDVYEVDGEPQRWTTGVLDHVEFFMAKVVG
jgi:hypothetical protein